MTTNEVLDLVEVAPPVSTEQQSPMEAALEQVQVAPEPVVEEPQVETPPVENEVVEDDNEVIIDQPEFDFTQLAEYGIKSVDDVKELTESLKNYKQIAETKFANDKVKEINDYVLSGGDIKKYVDAEKEIANYEDYAEQLAKVNPVDAYKESLKTMGLNEEEIEEHLDSMTDTQKKLEGMKIINQEKAAVAQMITEKKTSLSNTVAKQSEMQTKVKDVMASAIDGLQSVLNVKTSAKDRDVLKQQNPNDLIRKHFPLDEAGMPIGSAWAKSAAILEFAERNAKILQQKVASEVKKQEFDKLHNVQHPIQQEAAKLEKQTQFATIDDVRALRG